MAGNTGFGALLRACRHDAGMTLEMLSEASGVSVRAISDMELGHSRRPQRRTVTSLADALRLPPDTHATLLSTARGARPAAPPDRLQPPRTVWDFTGRGAELAWIESRLPAAPVVLCGPPGVGKTALAVRAAFPGDRLFVDLCGVADRHGAEGPRDALLEARPAERGALVILDNATDEAEVRPLLALCGPALVTSRGRLSGLAGVHRLRLGPLPPPDAADFLARQLGPARAGAEPEALARLAALCDSLPLALRIAGSRLASRPGWSVAHLVARLADPARRLAALTAGDLHLTAAFESSYRRLSHRAQRALHRLPPTGSASDAALDELVEAGLLEPVAGGGYGCLELVRLFGRTAGFGQPASFGRTASSGQTANSAGAGASTVTRPPRWSNDSRHECR